jgi:uroporphyrin-3 C-methyltransferase
MMPNGSADKTREPTVTETTDLPLQAEPDRPAPPTPTSPPAPRRAFSWFAFLAFLLALAALGVAGWQTWRDQIESDLADNLTSAAIRDQSLALSDLRQQVADLRADTRADRRLIEEKIAALGARIETLQQNIDELTAIDRSDWELAEADYLLQLANQRLLLGGDTGTALQLFQAADAILRAIDDSGLLPVRAALAQDLAAVKAVPAVDVDGIYLAIAAAADQAAALSLIRPPELPAATPTEPPPAADDTWSGRLGTGLEAALTRLGQLVQVRRREEPYQPLLAPQYEAALRQNLALMFEQAEAALLAGNQRLYEASLEKAQTWVTTYFTLDEQATRAVADTIAELKTRQIRPPIPDASASRRALNTFITSRRALLDGYAPAEEPTP